MQEIFNVNDIVQETGLSRITVWYHAKKLIDAGVISPLKMSGAYFFSRKERNIINERIAKIRRKAVVL